MTVGAVLSGSARFAIMRERAESFVDSLPDGCVNLLVTDPPYFGVKDEAWDNAWPDEDAFLAWLGEQCARWRRVLALDGSLYVFASPQMAARVEVEVRKWFSVLNHIVWAKPIEGVPNTPGRNCKEAQRQWFPWKEHVIFAEHHGVAVREDAQRAAVFAPLIAYFDGERRRAGIGLKTIDEALSCQMSGHWFTDTQWALPSRPMYDRLRALFATLGPGFLARTFDDLRVEYDGLLDVWVQRGRRSFSVTAEVHTTDVWTYMPVLKYDGKHGCEKPWKMGEDIVRASSRPGDVVADFFCGSGTFLAAAVANDRRAVGCDMDPRWVDWSTRRIEAGPERWKLFGQGSRRTDLAKSEAAGQLSLLKA